MSDVVQKLWGFCHTLRHDGIDYGDYIEQITYLLFLKMADERGVELPKGCEWPALRDKSGSELTDHYVDVLRKLGGINKPTLSPHRLQSPQPGQLHRPEGCAEAYPRPSMCQTPSLNRNWRMAGSPVRTRSS